jgi:hypothetical protein
MVDVYVSIPNHYLYFENNFIFIDFQKGHTSILRDLEK